MPYFIKPSIHLSPSEKVETYTRVLTEAKAILDGESDMILIMSTLNCLLKTNLPYYYWVGFYLYRDGKLHVGPYQGTLGCLHIEMGRGVCGRSAAERKTIIVDDCHALAQGSEHIACDPNSQSEIVVPVISAAGDLIAVLDVDSTLTGSFDEIDQEYLETLMQLLA